MNPEETIRKQESAINSHDAGALAVLYAASATVSDPFYQEPLQGRDAIEKDMADFLTAIPDLKIAASKVMVSGDTVAYEGRATGTHAGPMQTPTGLIPATNRPVEFKMGVFTRLNPEGEVLEERRYFDVAGIMGQLGLV